MTSRTIASILAGVAVFALGASPAGAFDAYMHSFKKDDCGRENVSDPVGIVFLGSAAREKFLYNGRDIRYHTRWKNHITSRLPTNRQWFATPLGCKGHDVEGDHASNDGGALSPPTVTNPFGVYIETTNRLHTRARYWSHNGFTRNGWLRHETHLTPHYDVACGTIKHRIAPARKSNGYISGFDFGRREFRRLYEKRPAHGHVITRGWGNTDRAKQPCTGEFAGGNGEVFYISYGEV